MEFTVLADAYERLEATQSRLEMMAILAELFKATPAAEIQKVAYLCQGVVAPPFEGIEVGMGERFVAQAIALASGYPLQRVEAEYKKAGDLGSAAERLMAERKQTALAGAKLSVAHVFDAFYRMATSAGKGSQEMKIKSLAELLGNASAREVRYLVRFPLGKLRLGIGDPTMLDALSVRTVGDKSARPALERAYNLCSDLGLVARTLYEKGMGGVQAFSVTVFRPIRPSLAERLPSAEEIIKKLGRCIAEAKYDGMRLAVHKSGSRVEIFSRRLEKVTAMFPEIVSAAQREITASAAIIEGEALAYNETTGEYYPFQLTMQRKRKYGVAEKAAEYPLRMFAFDLLYADGSDYTQQPYAERRKALAKTVKGRTITLSESIITEDAGELGKFFEQCVERGLEGIIAKDLNAPYVAGARKFAWIKLKRSYRGELGDTIDVVIVGYFLGRGARAEFGFGGVLGAVYDEASDSFKTVTKIGSGFSEEMMKALKRMLDGIKIGHRHARIDSLITPDAWTEPKYVITVAADEITKSPLHTCGKTDGSGYALRFPRMKGDVRYDKKPEDATSVAEIIEMFNMQKKVSARAGEA
jgi:DNA ligase-1